VPTGRGGELRVFGSGVFTGTALVGVAVEAAGFTVLGICDSSFVFFFFIINKN